MANSRRKYFRKTRKTRLRDLKHSVQGLIGMGASAASAILFIGIVAASFRHAGDAAYAVGSLGLISLVLSAGALVLGIFAIREPKVRPLAPRVSIGLGAVMTVVLGCLYIGALAF